MASRRKLKKNVNAIIEDLFMHSMMQELLNPEIDKNKVDDILTRIYNAENEFLSRISHTEPGNVKEYYKKFREDFSEETSQIIADIVALS